MKIFSGELPCVDMKTPFLQVLPGSYGFALVSNLLTAQKVASSDIVGEGYLRSQRILW